MFYGDVVKANLLALNDTERDVYNVDTTIGTDVNVFFCHLNELIGAGKKELCNPQAPGEQLQGVRI